jgi:hydroxymethylglutaryl-CoA lyase
VRSPQVEPLEGLPERITVYEVGPRDGLQNEKAVVPVEVKAEFVRRLVAAGLRTVETTSFVPARWVPQLADAAELLEALGDELDGVRAPVLVPNEKGLERALSLGVRDVAVFASATESFAKRNLNRTLAEQYAMFAPVVERAREQGLAVRGYVSMCFGDPWEGPVPLQQVVDAVVRLRELGCTEISLGDTIGTGTPGHVRALLARLADAGVPVGETAVHFHDTFGQALANTLAALQAG